MFTGMELQQMDASALELQLLVAQRTEPMDEDFLRDVVTGPPPDCAFVINPTESFLKL